MKKEALLMLLAGAVLGAVLSFIATRQYYQDKLAAVPPVTAPAPSQMPAPGPSTSGASSPEFDPAQHSAMLAEMEATVEKEPKNAEMRVQLGNFFYDAQKWDQAINYYEQALKLTPDNTDVLVDLGVCYRNVKRTDEALAMFAKALEVDPAKKQALFNEIVVYGLDKGDKSKAQALLKEFDAKYPGEPVTKQIAAELDKK